MNRPGTFLIANGVMSQSPFGMRSAEISAFVSGTRTWRQLWGERQIAVKMLLVKVLVKVVLFSSLVVEQARFPVRSRWFVLTGLSRSTWLLVGTRVVVGLVLGMCVLGPSVWAKKVPKRGQLVRLRSVVLVALI